MSAKTINRPKHEKILMADRSFLFYIVLTLKKLKYFVSYMINLQANKEMLWVHNKKLTVKNFLENFRPGNIQKSD